eukprot:799323-Karenia_brevis.AAC.1
MLGSPRRQHKEVKDTVSSCESESVDLELQSEHEEEEEIVEESWVEWVRRTTHLAEEHFSKVAQDDWITAQRRRKFRFAGHVARREDARWDTTLLNWTPEGRRKRGHPPK